MLPLVGKHIVLRDWQYTDLERYEYWLQPGQRWQELDAPYYSKPDRAEIEQLLAQLREAIASDTVRNPCTNLAVASNTTEELLGRVSWYWQSEETNWLSVGIVLYNPAIWGKGIGYEAPGLWSDYLLTSMPTLARLDLRTWSGNPGMIRLAQKLGYREEARFRNARIVSGTYYDGMGYGVLREEWTEQYPKGFRAMLGE